MTGPGNRTDLSFRNFTIFSKLLFRFSRTIFSTTFHYSSLLRPVLCAESLFAHKRTLTHLHTLVHAHALAHSHMHPHALTPTSTRARQPQSDGKIEICNERMRSCEQSRLKNASCSLVARQTSLTGFEKNRTTSSWTPKKLFPAMQAT